MNENTILRDLRDELEGEFGYALDLESSLAEAIEYRGVGSSAHAFINTAVKCLLAGLEAPATRLAKKARDWLVHSIESDERPERYFQYGTEAQRYYDVAIANWLIYGTHDRASLEASVRFREQYLNALKRPDRLELLACAHQYVDAAAIEKLLTRAQMLWSDQDVPIEISAAAWINNSTGGTWDQLHTFLHSHVPLWYKNGLFITMAAWLKIFYWSDASQRSIGEVLSVAATHLGSFPHSPRPASGRGVGGEG